MPSTKRTFFTTSANSAEPLNFFQRFDALWASLKTIVSVASRVPQPLVFFVLSRTVAKADSIGLVVRM